MTEKRPPVPGIRLSWQAISVLLTVTLVLVGAAVADIRATSRMEAQVETLAAAVKELSTNVKDLTKISHQAQIERIEIQRDLALIEQRLQAIEKKVD